MGGQHGDFNVPTRVGNKALACPKLVASLCCTTQQIPNFSFPIWHSPAKFIVFILYVSAAPGGLSSSYDRGNRPWCTNKAQMRVFAVEGRSIEIYGCVHLTSLPRVMIESQVGRSRHESISERRDAMKLLLCRLPAQICFC